MSLENPLDKVLWVAPTANKTDKYKVESGLVATGGSVELKAVHIEAHVLDLAAKVLFTLSHSLILLGYFAARVPEPFRGTCGGQVCVSFG